MPQQDFFTKQIAEHRANIKAFRAEQRQYPKGSEQWETVKIHIRIEQEAIEDLLEEQREERMMHKAGSELACTRSLEELARGLGMKSTDAVVLKDEANYLMMRMLAFELVTDPKVTELLNHVDAMRQRAQIDMGVREWPSYFDHLKPVPPMQHSRTA